MGGKLLLLLLLQLRCCMCLILIAVLTSEVAHAAHKTNSKQQSLHQLATHLPHRHKGEAGARSGRWKTPTWRNRTHDKRVQLERSKAQTHTHTRTHRSLVRALNLVLKSRLPNTDPLSLPPLSSLSSPLNLHLFTF